jgi:beta-galactosidase
MKKIYVLLLMLATLMPLSANSGRITESFNFGWRFHAGDVANGESLSLDDSGWQVINVPHDFQIHQPWVAPAKDERADNSDIGANVKSRLSSRAFKEMGIGWYRKTITPDASLKGKRIILDFEGIMLVGDVYVNGKHVGGTDYGYLGFEIDVTKMLKFGEPNVIAVKANTMNPDNSRWYTGGGLFRDVTLIATDAQQHFTRHPLYITTPVVGTDKSVVEIQAELGCYLRVNSLKMNTTIIAQNGDTVYNKTKDIPFNRGQKVNEHKVDSITLEQPRLWSCEDPHLYKAVVTMYRPDGTVADQVSSNFGIRSIEYSPKFGFKLNGKKVIFKGIANHHTLGALGAAVYPRAIEKRIQLLKEFGFNHIRTAHNPYSKSFLDLCDKYGMLVVDELYDKWLTKFAGGRVEWTNLWQHDVPEFIRQDRNHPSVVMWSLGNELQTYWALPYADWGVTPYRLQKQLLLRYDDTRPVTVAMHPRGRHQTTDSLPAPLVHETDIAAYNYRYMYFPGDGKRFPNMIFYQSEANTSMMGPNYFEMDLDKVIGLAYWGMIDYLGESHGWPAKGWAQGVFDISLEPKPIAYLLKSIFQEDKPVVHIGIIDSDQNTIWNDVQVGVQRMSDHWNRIEGSTMSLWTYTNADEVELKVNGKTVGTMKNDKKNPRTRNKLKWNNVKYEKGYIEAIARTGGKIVARHRIETVGDAKKITAAADNNEWKADGMDLQHVRVEAVDSKGRRVQGANNKLTFNVEGPAEIVGVINGDITSEELTVGNTRRLFNGTATVILRSTKQPGEVKLNIVADGLKGIKAMKMMSK